MSDLIQWSGARCGMVGLISSSSPLAKGGHTQGWNEILKTGEHEQSESGGKGLVLPIASKSRGRHVPSRPQTRSTPGHTGPKGSTVVQGRIGATKVAKDLQTSGTDDV